MSLIFTPSNGLGEINSGKRKKYVCPDCEAKAWGKEGMQLKCAECDLTAA